MKGLFAVVLALVGFPQLLWAKPQGAVTSNVMVVASELGNIVSKFCTVIGIGFLVAALIQYQQHKKNPLQVRFSQPIFLFILGLILIGLPFLSGVAQGWS